MLAGSALLAAGCFDSKGGSPPPGPEAGVGLDSGSLTPDARGDSTTAADSPPEGAAGGPDGADATGPEAGSDGSVGDAGATDALADGEAGADAAPLQGAYVDPVNGLDTNSGTYASPFKTVLKASQLIADAGASLGQTIRLFPGTYDSTNQSTLYITFPPDTWLRAVTPGTVTFKHTGGGLIFNGGGVQDVAIQDFGNSSSAIGMAINVTGSGTFSTTGVSFSNVGCPLGVVSSSSATVTIDMTGVATPISNVPQFLNCAMLFVDGTSNVTWKGGGVINQTWASTPSSAAVFARGASTVTLDGVTLQHYPQNTVVAFDNAHVTLKNSLIDDCGAGSQHAILVGGQNTQVPVTPSLTLDTTSVTASHGNAISLQLYGGTPETPSLTFVNSHVDRTIAGDAVNVAGAPTNAALSVTITATSSTFTGNGGRGITSPRATVTLTGGDVSTNTGRGVELTDPGSTNSIKVRSTTFGGNGGDFIALQGAASSSLDLGLTGDPGGIVFTAVPVNYSAVNLAAAVAGQAVGNTWIAGQQGANGSGLYTSATTLAAGASGLNATVAAGASLVVQ
jgi:hypothetical protein